MTISAMKSKTPAITAPEYLEASTKDWFLSVMADYEMEPHHVRLLTAACECWDRMQLAREAIRQHGLTMVDPKTLLRGHVPKSILREIQKLCS
jgi:phage terminase small subunit